MNRHTSPSECAGTYPWLRYASWVLMVASGFAGLGYQIVWTQQSALLLGHESAAVLAVITAFFGGIAAGAVLLGSRLEHSHRPLCWYVACECVIAFWSLLLIALMTPFSPWLLRAMGEPMGEQSILWHWMVAFCGTFFLLLPATMAMGATLPAMERLSAQIRGDRSIAALYASNTLGAVIGVLATAFWLLPHVGLTRTVILCAVLNLLCVALASVLFRGAAEPKSNTVAPVHTAQRSMLCRLFITGLLGIGYEVLVVRVLSQTTEGTVYTFAMLLAVYLIGSTAGAAGYQHWFSSDRNRDQERLTNALLCLLAAACLIGTATLWGAEVLKAWLNDLLGPSMSSAIAAESFTAIVAFGPPTVAMGALFSHLNNSAHQAGMSFGRALGANTLGAAFAPLVFGVLALPTLGPKFALLSIAAGYLLLSSWRHWRVPFFLAPPILVAATALAIAIWAPPLVFIDVPEGGHVVSYQQGIMAAVSVIEDADDVATLRIDNRQQEGSSATRRVDARQALLPILLHPTPRRVLFLGLGTGVTAASATADPALEVDAVELLPEVIAASNYFRGAAQSRLNVITADARRFVRASSSVYDVIVSDNFHPARSGSGSLYTVEHFEAVRVRLSTGGIFCQWLPLHQLDLDTFRSITKSFLSVYPQASALIASNSLETPVIGLIGQRDVVRIDVDAVRAHLARVTTINGLTDIGIEDEFALLGSFIAGPAALDRFAGDADINTDDRPIVAYRAPRITYAPDSRPRDRLIALLQASFVRPEDIVSPLTDNASQSRLAAYWLARNQFIEAGRDIVPSHDARQMLAQVHEPLLSVLRISPDFRPAYDPLLRIAVALAQTDVDSSRALLSELSLSQPSRPEANAALNQLVQTR